MSSVKTEDLSLGDPSHESEEYHRALGLQVVSGLSNELRNVKKAALIDSESLIKTTNSLGRALEQTSAFLEGEMKGVDEVGGFREALVGFVGQCESDIEWLKDEERRITALVRSTGDYFHGRAGREEGSHLFVIVRDFLVMLDKACLDVKSLSRGVLQVKVEPRKEESTIEINRQLFPAMRECQLDDDFSSDDEG
ncbi:formin-like protein [Striga asiatica]|uniref:Formin-like protein n=1 Tax=Striga asiatica TaxID=4170 RepID=A0A5A7PFB2_STRAF|nr:formin-like protein [Striga asiatica]